MKLTIRTRLLIAFGLLISLSGIIYYLGDSNAAALNASVTKVVKIHAKRVILSGKIAEDIQYITKRERDLVLTQNDRDLQEIVRDVEQRKDALGKRINEISVDASERGLVMLGDFDVKWKAYLKILNQIKHLTVEANTEESNQEAYLLSSTQASIAALESLKVIESIVTKNEIEMAEADEATNELFQQGRINMITLLVISIILSGVVAYWIITSINASIRSAQRSIRAISEGDLNVKIDTSKQDEIGELMIYLQSMVNKLKEVITSVWLAADNIAAASVQMSSSSQQMSEGATEQAASAEEVSSSMEEMAANIQQNTDNALQTEKIALKAAEDIQDGSKAVNATVSSMKEIAGKIGIIGEIARQTNLLALNAAVEAARAGEHGRGFAVVAAEVRKLAERSQAAATEIDQVSASSVAVAEKSGKLLEEIVPDIQKTARLVQEISASSREQTSGSDQINAAIQQLNEITQQNAAAAEEVASSSEELSSQSEQMRETIGYFRIDEVGGRRHARTQQNKVAKKAPMASNKTHFTPKKQGASLRMGEHDGDFETFK